MFLELLELTYFKLVMEKLSIFMIITNRLFSIFDLNKFMFDDKIYKYENKF